jgi:hypothetical protein
MDINRKIGIHSTFEKNKTNKTTNLNREPHHALLGESQCFHYFTRASCVSHMDILFVTAASQTKMPPNQETICFEELKDFPVKIKRAVLITKSTLLHLLCSQF